MERYRFHSEAAVYFVTFSVVQWLPVFVFEESCKIVTDSFNFCHHRKGLRINAYVVMPTHLHAILFHESFRADLLIQVVTDFRKFTGRQLSDLCDRKLPQCFAKTLKSEAGDDRERKFWQTSRHPVAIENEPFWRTKFDYLHLNPCRKGLVHRAVDWRFSSASHWIESDWSETIANDVLLSALQW
jgi:putative transposase